MPRVTFTKLNESEKAWLIQMMFNRDVPMLERRDRVCEKFNITERTVWTWRKRLREELVEVAPPVQAATDRKVPPGRNYIVTWAQNATPTHRAFFRNLEVYAKHVGAEILVIPGRYRNPSLLLEQGKLETQEWWDEDVTDYLTSSRVEIVPGLVLVGDIKVQPTAVNPMRSFEGLVGDKSAIFGHPKAQLRSMPHLPGHDTPIHLTSLACTRRNYSDTKAGKKGEHKHAVGFVMVENLGTNFHVRQVVASDNGDFTDVYSFVSDGRVQPVTTCEAFVMGDIHLRQVEMGVVDATLSYLDKVAPSGLVLHDVFDGQSVNHHAASDPFQAADRLLRGNHLINEEIEDVVKFVERLADYGPVLVFSNHCEWIDRHLVTADWKKDIPNAATYLNLAARKLNIPHDKGVLHDIIDERCPFATTLGPNDSYKTMGWELGAHGHLGVNGARGGMQSFRKFNTKIIFGHFHGTERYGDAVQVGTYTQADMGYNRGPSSWAHAGAIIHTDGQVQQYIFKKVGPGDEWSFTSFRPANDDA